MFCGNAGQQVGEVHLFGIHWDDPRRQDGSQHGQENDDYTEHRLRDAGELVQRDDGRMVTKPTPRRGRWHDEFTHRI